MANPKLLQTLEAGGNVVAPAVYDALTARLMEHLGFNAVGVYGSSTGWVLGVLEPLMSANDIAGLADRVVKGIHDSLPVIVDGSNGYGGPVATRHTVQMLEDAGASAVHIDDHIFPYKIDYLRGGGQLTSTDEWQQRIEQAVKARRSRDFLIIARTDEYREGVGSGNRQSALKRVQAALEAGADCIQPKGSKSVDDLVFFRKNIKDVPLCDAFGPGFEIPEMHKAGWQIVLHAGVTLTVSLMAIYKAYQHVKETGYRPADFQEQARAFRPLMDKLSGMDEAIALDRELSAKRTNRP